MKAKYQIEEHEEITDKSGVVLSVGIECCDKEGKVSGGFWSAGNVIFFSGYMVSTIMIL